MCVIGPAGIGIAGGQIWMDGTLDILGDGATLTLYDVGSQSHWINEIRLANTSGNEVSDYDDHFGGTSGGTNGTAPFQFAGSRHAEFRRGRLRVPADQSDARIPDRA